VVEVLTTANLRYAGWVRYAGWERHRRVTVCDAKGELEIPQWAWAVD